MINFERFKDQFILTKSHDLSLQSSDWNLNSIGEWFLYCHVSLPVINIMNQDKKKIGWLLGYANCSEGFIGDDKDIILATEVDDFLEVITEWIEDLDGRYLGVFFNEDDGYIFTDPGGFLSVLYSKKYSIIASTINLFPSASDERDLRKKLIEDLAIPKKDHWYPFGLTERHSIKRLLPNHYLYLTDFSTRRYWPTSESSQTIDIPKSIEQISNRLNANIGFLSDKFELLLPLTAGRDSRILLAYTKRFKEDVLYLTLAIPDKNGKMDCAIASKMAHTYNLNYEIVEFEEALNEELDDWQERTGRCIGGRTWQNVRTLQKLNKEKVILDGLGGEVGRSYYWRKSDRSVKPDIIELIKRMKLPLNHTIIEHGKIWLEALEAKGFSQNMILDLLYIEQRLGCWAGPQQYGHIISRFKISPFSSRKIFKIMIGLPDPYRKKQLMTNDLIKVQWPQLLRFPFNSYGLLYSLKIKIKGRINMMLNKPYDS